MGALAAELIRRTRERAGLSQRVIAARAGTSGATVAHYETGANDPRAETFARILRAAGSELHDIPARTRNQLFVDLMCERFASEVAQAPNLIGRAREVLAEQETAWREAWLQLLDAGPAAVVGVLTSKDPAVRGLKSDAPFAVMSLVSTEERRRIHALAWKAHRAA